jgi:glycosyltransferase involved in cell wall biosynthesis
VVEKNTEEFSNAVLSLLRDEKKCDVLGKNGWGMVLRDFSPKGVAQKWMREYAEIIKNYHG